MNHLLRLALLVLCLCLGRPTHADELRPGYLALTQQSAHQWKMVWKAPVLGGLATHAHPQLPTFCHQAAPVARLVSAALLLEAEVTCDRDFAGATIGIAGMDAAFTDALVRIAPLGKPVQAARLTAANTFFVVATTPAPFEVARTYALLGVTHILTGYDHLLFVVALVLLLGRLGPVIKAATAFTLAHSITLAGTTLGLFGLAQAPVEALIALSIVFLAVEVVKQSEGEMRLSERVPWLVAFLFGLIHGFGFAGALREIGLPEGDVPIALLTFNLGVELGQVLIILAIIGAIAALRRFVPAMLRPATVAASYAIGTTASFWFIARLIG